MTAPLLCISHAVLPEQGEDSFAFQQDDCGSFLCVADGCGGLGSKRYPDLEGRTGAAIASALACETFASWAQTKPMPSTCEHGQSLCRELEEQLFRSLSAFQKKHDSQGKSRITGSMQHNLPTTLCAAVTRQDKEVCYLWAGDSRGYVLDADGLHQCTQDHLRGAVDPFEALYLDKPLARYISADRKAQLSLHRMRLTKPCVVMVGTDGVFGSLPTPMEFEMLLLDTLLSARGLQSWQTKMTNRIRKLAQDDATLLLLPFGCDSFDSFQQALTPRRGALQKAFITPVRRHRGDIDFARSQWLGYQPGYDWTEGAQHAGMDW